MTVDPAPDPWQALRAIVDILGPEKLCNCLNGCRALRLEAEAALEIAQDALTAEPPVTGCTGGDTAGHST